MVFQGYGGTRAMGEEGNYYTEINSKYGKHNPILSTGFAFIDTERRLAPGLSPGLLFGGSICRIFHDESSKSTHLVRKSSGTRRKPAPIASGTEPDPAPAPRRENR
jgi:hypothetical protein